MAITRKSFIAAASAALTGSLAACAPATQQPAAPSAENNSFERDFARYARLQLEMDAWHFDADHNVYYQLGVPYCLEPSAEAFQKLSIFVPGAYFQGEKNGDTYLCTLRSGATCGSFTTETAPVLMPINCQNYGSQQPDTAYSYEGLAPYLTAGCVYVFAGCRGRAAGFDSNTKGDGFYAAGMPWNLVDLKAAIRYIKLNAQQLPGARVAPVVLGLGDGANLAALLGVSSNQPSFDPYLEAIGAVKWDMAGSELSDVPSSVALWCPRVSLARADGAYEWMSGQYQTADVRSAGSFGQALSHDLAAQWAEDLNALALMDAQNTALTLEPSASDTYAAGTFYDNMQTLIEDAASTFFEVTTFPSYVGSAHTGADAFPGGIVTADAQEEIFADGAPHTNAAELAPQMFISAERYVEQLNGQTPWLTYDSTSQKVNISTLGAYSKAMLTEILPCPAFDVLTCNSYQNQVFGVRDRSVLHYSKRIWETLNQNMFDYTELEGYDPSYVGAWGTDLQVKNDMVQNVQKRAQVADVFEYLAPDGAYVAEARLAKNWRINMGCEAATVPLAAAYALERALAVQPGVTTALNVVWGKGFELCEVRGDAASNVVAWLKELVNPS